MKLVNVGCGSAMHPAWCNLDLDAREPGVLPHDVRNGLPFADETCDAVYHSHVLEHLARRDARSLLAECFRVLKPGGVLRVAVPDLESIARTYLAKLDEASRHSQAAADHEWMTVELLDQMVRTRSGGEMIRYLSDQQVPNQNFIRSRVGAEVRRDPPGRAAKSARPLLRRMSRLFQRVRQDVALAVVAVVAGPGGRASLREAFFRQSGEVHRWMYDRVSLQRLLQEIGFVRAVSCAANDSRIPAFDEYQLEVVQGEVRKPDSLFMEAQKPESRT